MFGKPDFRAPLDIELRQERCPSGEVKGMFFQSIADDAAARCGKAVGRGRYVGFRGYPLSEWLGFLPEAARAAHPKLPEREGIRLFGQAAYDTFLKSTAGRVLFSLAGKSPHVAVSFISRAFKVIGSHGTVDVVHNANRRAVLELRNMWDYIDAWHVGIYEGALRAFGLTGTVLVRMHSYENGDLEVTWL